MAKFIPNGAGFEELCKSKEMCEMLEDKAATLSNRANAQARPSDVKVSHFKVEPYGYGVDVLSHSAVGVAFTRTKLGVALESKHKYLLSQNH